MKRLIAWSLAALAALVVVACSNGFSAGGSKPDAPTNVQVTPGDSSALVSWDMKDGIEYWIFIAQAPAISTDNWTTLPEARVVRNAVSPQIIAGLTNGKIYAFTVNGRRDDGPGGVTLEWRLHPVPGFERPATLTAYDLFGAIALAVARDEEPVAPVEALWDGLEAFAAYGDEVEPATLASAATEALGIAPDAAGLADHLRVGDDWERTGNANGCRDSGDSVRPDLLHIWPNPELANSKCFTKSLEVG